MSMVRPAVYDNGIVRMTQQGDLIADSEAILTLTNAASQQLTGAQLTSGILLRTGPVAGYADTFPAATDLVAALLNNYYLAAGAYSPSGLQQNMAFRLRVINSVAFANTVVAGTGVTLGTNVNQAASSWKDYLITILNGSPAVVYTGNTTSGTATVTGLLPVALQNVTVGAIVTGTGIPAATTVIGIGTNNTITLSANATATNAAVALTFSPAYRVDSLGGGTL